MITSLLIFITAETAAVGVALAAARAAAALDAFEVGEDVGYRRCAVPAAAIAIDDKDRDDGGVTPPRPPFCWLDAAVAASITAAAADNG